jgi:hypothetical protein
MSVKTIPTVVLATVVALAAYNSAFSQGRNISSRDSVATIQEKLSDPDPLQRLANFETMVASYDAPRLQIATKFALSGNDAELRGLAFKAYLSKTRRIVFELGLEPGLKAAMEKAERDPQESRRLESRTIGLRDLLNTNFRTDLTVFKFDFGTGQGEGDLSIDSGGRQAAEIFVSREKLFVRSSPRNRLRCNLEVAATKDLTFDGFMVCERSRFGRVSVSGPLF